MRTTRRAGAGLTGLTPRLLAFLAGILCTLAVAATGAQAATPSASTMGVYVGGGNTSAFAGYSSWLGSKPAHVLDFLSDSSWSTIDNPTWTVAQWGGSSDGLVLSVPMLPASGATLAQGATGGYNSYFTQLAKSLVAGGDGAAIIRLGWEMNGNWFPWSIQNGNAANYAQYWREIVDTMRAVSPSFRFDFCPNDGSSTVGGTLLNPESAYPGDAYVNYIGTDLYDQSWAPNSSVETNRWNGYSTQPYGLEWQRNFAAAHGKQVSFPEWGLWQGGNGGGDSPAFIQDMYNWMASSNLAYEDYFDFSNSVLSTFPNGAATYRRLFGPTATAPASPATPSAATSPASTRTSARSPHRHGLAAIAIMRPLLRIKHLRGSFFRLSWRANGAAVRVLRKRHRARIERRKSSIVLRLTGRTASFRVCELGTNLCSAPASARRLVRVAKHRRSPR